MSESKTWTDQWFKAQQQFVDAWSDLAKSGEAATDTSQSEIWARSFDTWCKTYGGDVTPDLQKALQKCVDMGKAYFAMAEQVSKSVEQGEQPLDAINQWLEQLKANLSRFTDMAQFDQSKTGDFMQQWFNPAQAWQQMAAAYTPMQTSAWQLPGASNATADLETTFNPFAKMLSSPTIGFFREAQQRQQRGIQLLHAYNQANIQFNQAFMRVSLESIQDFQARMLKPDTDTSPQSLRQLYDLWVEISEQHYSDFAMSNEYQTLYGSMVNRLMTLKQHCNDTTDEFLASMNLPNSREIDTMQHRLQQLRRENRELKREIDEIKSLLTTKAAPTVEAMPVRQKRTAAKKRSVPKKTVVTKAKAGA